MNLWPLYPRESMMRRHFTTFMLGLMLCMPSEPSHGQAPQPLNALDYFEIQQLVSKYARAIDTCSNNGYDYADLFTADGYFAPEQDGKIGTKAGPRAAGRSVRRRIARLQERRLDQAGREALYVNHIITPSPEGAAARWTC